MLFYYPLTNNVISIKNETKFLISIISVNFYLIGPAVKVISILFDEHPPLLPLRVDYTPRDFFIEGTYNVAK